MLAIGIEMTNKQTSSHNGLYNSLNKATKGLEIIKAATLA